MTIFLSKTNQSVLSEKVRVEIRLVLPTFNWWCSAAWNQERTDCAALCSLFLD